MEVVLDDIETPVEITKSINGDKNTVEKKSIVTVSEEKQYINCLRNETVIVKFLPKKTGLVTDPRHVLYGGLGENSKRRFVVPVLQSGVYKNILTNLEKDYLEYIMDLPENALSVYKKTDNFWANKSVTLGKEKTLLDLSVPDDYIKYKILLANDDFIAPSEESLKHLRKATYQFVITRESDEYEHNIQSLTTTSKAYMLFGQFKEDLKKLAAIIEIATGKTVSRVEKKYVYSQVEVVIKDSPEKFIKAAEDIYLDTKILIKDAIETGHIRKSGQYYYLTEGNKPLCTGKQEPTLQSACEYLNAPKYQEVLFTLQSKVTG